MNVAGARAHLFPWLCCFCLAIFPIAASASGAEAAGPAALPHPLALDQDHGRIELQPGGLLIAPEKGTDLFAKADGSAATDNLPRALFAADGDFFLSAQVLPAFGGAAYEGAALIVHGGERCWGKLLFERFASGSNGIATTVANGRGGDDAYHGTRAAEAQYLKIVRRGGGWIFYASQDGSHWEFLRQFALDCAGPVRVGFAAQAPLSDGFEAAFTALRYRAGTISDFWQGE